MTPDDESLDLASLGADAEVRAARIRTAVLARISAPAPRLLDVTVDRLARIAIPSLLAAAAAVAAVATTRQAEPRADPFVAWILPRGPARQWAMLDRAPETAELTFFLRGNR
jgi:hypothetical protein